MVIVCEDYNSNAEMISGHQIGQIHNHLNESTLTTVFCRHIIFVKTRINTGDNQNTISN